MNYQIDQSIKIEDTRKATFVCLSNSKEVVIEIPAKDKRYLKLFFRKLRKPLIFKLFTFAVLCFRAIKELSPSKVQIDKEYLGNEELIKTFIIQILTLEKIKIPQIEFFRVGKASFAHIKAYGAYKKRKYDIQISSSEVLRLYDAIDKK